MYEWDNKGSLSWSLLKLNLSKLMSSQNKRLGV